MNQSELIIIAVISIIVLSVVAYYTARFMKGSLKMTLNQRNARGGEALSGALTLQLKKGLVANRLFVALIGEREVRNRRSGDSNNSKEWREFYRDEIDLLVDEDLQPHHTQTYQFQLNTPGSATEQADKSVSEVAEGIDNPVGKKFVKGVAAVAKMGQMSGRKRWFVVARLDTKGVDLVDKQKIHISF